MSDIVTNTLASVSANFKNMTFNQQVETSLRSLQMIVDNGYTLRSLMFGLASNSERQRDYISSSLLPKMAARAKALLNTAVSQPEQREHNNADDGDPNVQLRQQIERINQQEASIEELNVIIDVAVKIHDELSMDLEQLSYSAIRAGGAAKVVEKNGLVTNAEANMLNKYLPKKEAKTA